MAAKIKDGLFLGDYETAQDLDFILANKITHIICCAGRELANCWERSGVKYLTYYWPENGNCIVFDEANAVLDEIYVFIEEAIEKGESVLVHSTDGVSRASFCCAVYFMLKYRWILSKTMAYLQTKRPDLEPKPGFMRQLVALDQSLQRVTRSSARGKDDPVLRKCSEWDPALVLDVPDAPPDEIVLANTFVNSAPAPEEVVIAAQTSTPMPRVPAGLLGEVQLTRFGSLNLPTALPPGFTLPPKRKLCWIDDPHRPKASCTHTDVPVLPGTRRPTPERPPTSSYNSLALGPGWIDASGESHPVSLPSPDPNSSHPILAHVAPCTRDSVSLAAVALPPSLHGLPLARLKSCVRGSHKWVGQQKLKGVAAAEAQQQQQQQQQQQAAAAAAVTAKKEQQAAAASANAAASQKEQAAALREQRGDESGALQQQQQQGMGMGENSKDTPSSGASTPLSTSSRSVAQGGDALDSQRSEGRGEDGPQQQQQQQQQQQKAQQQQQQQFQGGRSLSAPSTSQGGGAGARSAWNPLSATNGPVRATAAAISGMKSGGGGGGGEGGEGGGQGQSLHSTLASLAGGNMGRNVGGGGGGGGGPPAPPPPPPSPPPP